MSNEIKSSIDDPARKIDITPFNSNIKNPCGAKQKNDDKRQVEDIYRQVMHNLKNTNRNPQNISTGTCRIELLTCDHQLPGIGIASNGVDGAHLRLNAKYKGLGMRFV